MKRKILLIGSNSDISKALVFENSSKYEFIQISSTTSSFNVRDKNTFPQHNNLDGLVYYPGTINLKPFANLKEKDFQQDYEINVLGLINSLQLYSSIEHTISGPSLVILSVKCLSIIDAPRLTAA